MKTSKRKYCLLFYSLFFLMPGCMNSNTAIQKENTKISTPKKIQKPPSSFHDTVTVQPMSAVFFEPDSLQLEKLKQISDERIFKGTMHEYFYQMRNANNFLKRFNPKLHVVWVKTARFLSFCKFNKTFSIIDLNNYEAKGLFVFDGKKEPVLIEMTNVETQVSD